MADGGKKWVSVDWGGNSGVVAKKEKAKKKNTTPFTSIVLYDGTLTKRFPRYFAILEMQNNRIFLRKTVFLLNTGAGD